MATEGKSQGRVVPITGEWTIDVLSQEYYAMIAEKQAEVHELQLSLARDLLLIETRLKEGGNEEDGPLYYDHETHLIRHRYVKRPVAPVPPDSPKEDVG